MDSRLQVVEVASNGEGSGAPAESAASAVVAPAALAPVNTVLPSIGGVPMEGRTLEADWGSWLHKPTRYLPQWQRCDASGGGCVAIAGATERQYVLRAADVGQTVRVEVRAENGSGVGSATSAASAVVAVGPPQNTARPSVTGPAREDEQLSADAGAWTNAPTSYTYQWERCTGSAASVAAIQADGPLGYWRLGESAGTVARAAAGPDGDAAGPDGEYVGAVTLGRAGAPVGGDTAVALGGGHVRVPADDELDPSGTLSLQAWLKRTDDTAGPLLEFGNGSTQTVQVWNKAGDDGIADDVYVNLPDAANPKHELRVRDVLTETGRWYHLTVTYDNAWLRVFVNGAQVDALRMDGVAARPAGFDLHLGWRRSSDSVWQGELDEVAVYDHALSAARVAEHYQAAALLDCTDIVGADQPSYTPTAADVGQRLRVRVSATNAQGSTGALSDWSVPVEPRS